jgi:predicted aldo/keto reductase-like oxidoreductase
MMTNMNRFSANVAAALDRTELSGVEMGFLRRFAKKTRSFYCAGCTQICQTALDKAVPIGDVMRCLMYANSYGDHECGRTLFNNLPEKTRREMADLDYAAAERLCPQHIAIGEVLKRAVEAFG